MRNSRRRGAGATPQSKKGSPSILTFLLVGWYHTIFHNPGCWPGKGQGSSVIDRQQLEEAALIVQDGGVVIVPTETFYALAADPFQATALARIFEIKGRPDSKPLPLIAADMDAVLKAVRDPGPKVRRLMDRFWPGSLTILLEPALRSGACADVRSEAQAFNRLCTDPRGKIGVRVPPSCAARELARLAGGWITATSANLSGDPDPDRIAVIDGSVTRAVDMVLDPGPTPGGLPSTLIDPVGEDLRILRVGAVPEALIRDWYKGSATTVSDV